LIEVCCRILQLSCFPSYSLLYAKYLWHKVDLRLRPLWPQFDRTLLRTILFSSTIGVVDHYMISVWCTYLATASEHSLFICLFPRGLV
jgi:hypothetical protein